MAINAGRFKSPQGKTVWIIIEETQQHPHRLTPDSPLIFNSRAEAWRCVQMMRLRGIKTMQQAATYLTCARTRKENKDA